MRSPDYLDRDQLVLQVEWEGASVLAGDPLRCIYVDAIYVERSYLGGFIGRAAELAVLRKRLDRVARTGTGSALALRGRRQVGKSRLVQEFCDRAGVPYVFSTATKGASPIEAVDAFLRDVRESALPADPELVPALQNGTWPDAFRGLVSVLPDAPSILVLDELPWLAEQDALFDGALQTGWDRLLASRPVLLLLLGSDVRMMERLTAYDRPFYGRADTMVLGLPGIVRTCPHGTPALEFLEEECADPDAALFGVPEASLLAEFPNPDVSRRVIEAVGSGDRTHANIAASAGSRAGALPRGRSRPCCGASPRRSGSSRWTSRCRRGRANPPSTASPTATCACTWRRCGRRTSRRGGAVPRRASGSSGGAGPRGAGAPSSRW